MKDLGIEVQIPTSVLVANPVYHEITKHIEVNCHFIREKIQQGLICTKNISTQEQPADMLTKGLTRLQYQLLMFKLGLQNIFSPSSLRESVDIKNKTN